MVAPVFRSELADAIRQGLPAGATVAVILLRSLLNSAFDSDLNSKSSLVVDNFSAPKSMPRYADFGYFLPSSDAFYVANWIADSADNLGSDFILIDKKNARVFNSLEPNEEIKVRVASRMDVDQLTLLHTSR